MSLTSSVGCGTAAAVTLQVRLRQAASPLGAGGEVRPGDTSQPSLHAEPRRFGSGSALLLEASSAARGEGTLVTVTR